MNILFVYALLLSFNLAEAKNEVNNEYILGLSKDKRQFFGATIDRNAILLLKNIYKDNPYLTAAENVLINASANSGEEKQNDAPPSPKDADILMPVNSVHPGYTHKSVLFADGDFDGDDAVSEITYIEENLDVGEEDSKTIELDVSSAEEGNKSLDKVIQPLELICLAQEFILQVKERG